MRMSLVCRVLVLPAVLFVVRPALAADASRYFAIEVVDEQTGRGVPLVELKTVSLMRYYTDSAGLVAIDDPALLGRTIFFNIASHGYEYPADGFGMRGARIDLKPGGSAKLKIKRINIAERLYRVTGEGIYRDSVLLGRPVPIQSPLVNAQVTGQDSTQTIVYQDRIFWFWGDTGRQSYPLGQFSTSGATSALPGKGGLDPSAGVDLKYFVGDDGFSRPMFPRVDSKLLWLDGLMTLPDESGKVRMLAAEGEYKTLGAPTARRLNVYDDDTQAFRKVMDIPLDAPLYPTGHPFRVTRDDQTWYYFSHSFPDVRVKADWKSVVNLSDYEAFTCLVSGTHFDKGKTRIERDARGKPVWGWKRNTGALEREYIVDLVKRGLLKDQEVWLKPADVETGKLIFLHNGSTEYNEFKKKWVMIAGETFGKPSFLGEIWYLEADQPEGPWTWARRIVTHDRYSLYNPRHHPFFDQADGRVIYFEGTYCTTFSRQEDPTPRYDYNQIMYRLDLADPRLTAPSGK